MRDDVHGLLATIIRMSAPADVAEQTGSVAKSSVRLRRSPVPKTHSDRSMLINSSP